MSLRFLTSAILLAVVSVAAPPVVCSQDSARPLLQIDDLFRMDGPQAMTLSPDATRAAYVRRWIDAETRAERFSLWISEGDPAEQRPLESGKPDARSPVFSPDGKWIAVRSVRPRPDGWTQTPSVPAESDAATDIWLVSSDGNRVLPLAGPEKPYGRVFNDPFYGRVAFSPDGRSLVFVADDGRDPRTPEELANDVQIVRPDQGEGYTGYGAAQVWIAELESEPTTHAARRIRRLTDDGIWYGDPQWSPDGKRLVCHANKSGDVESVRYSINHNFDLWSIDVETGRQRRLTDGPGPEVSPRVSPDGTRVAFLCSPRRGPHADVFNLAVISPSENGIAPPTVLFDHHAAAETPPPHPVPAFPLPESAWDGDGALAYTTYRGITTDTIRLDIESKLGETLEPNSSAASANRRKELEARQRLTPSGNAILKERTLGEDRRIEWTNEGLTLEGVITIPPEKAAQPPYPLVVYPHGGPHSRSVLGFNLTAQMLAAHGYLVFQPNFRGSAGYGRTFLDADRNDLGGGDMRDILSGIESLVRENLVDPERQFVYGVSYGGFMTSWLVGHTGQFRAAVAQNAVTDMNVMWGLSDLQSWTEWELGGRPWEIAEAMRKHSPISHVARIRTPTLILHSREDRRCPIAMGRMFHQSLLARGVPTQMVVYPNEGHGIRQPRHQADVLTRTIAWFRLHDPAHETRIVTLGDSITKGVRPGVATNETFAAVLERELREKGKNARVTNVGIGGERTDQALKRLQRDVIEARPHFVTIMYGTNDSYVDRGKSESRLPIEQYRSNLVELVTRLREVGIQPVLMTEPRWGAAARSNGLDEHPNVRLEKYVEACREVARETRTPLIDHFADWSAEEGQGQDLGDWTTDQCHPNAAGHERMVRRMLPEFVKLLEKTQP